MAFDSSNILFLHTSKSRPLLITKEHMNITKQKSLRLFIRVAVMCSLSLLLGTAKAQAQDAAVGEQLFKQNCTSCHMVDKKLVGPALRGVSERREEDWLIKWIRNSPELIASGDKDAVAIFEEYNQSAMNTFPQFSDDDIKNILNYIETAPAAAITLPGDPSPEGVAAADQGASPMLLISIIVLLVLCIYALSKAKNALKEANNEEAVGMLEGGKRWLAGNPVAIVLLIILLVIGGIKEGYNLLLQIGVQQSYQPEQPIAFSHRIHAGDQGIDCNYCHSGARESKTSGIPSANVCMNCHTYINEGTETGTTEISKIYDAVGFDPETKTYIEGYEQKPIEWIRIHNLPDLAYFNHAQHVTAGQQECQTCHGEVQEMDVVEQHAPLTMGWCIDCHRNTEVDMDNLYYEDLHENWVDKFHGEKITVDKIGGLECGKCHY